MTSIYDAFGPVDLDPCAHPSSPVIASRRIIPAEGGDGLSDPWSGRLAFVNPPYSAQLHRLKRAYQQWSTGNVQTVVLPAAGAHGQPVLPRDALQGCRPVPHQGPPALCKRARGRSTDAVQSLARRPRSFARAEGAVRRTGRRLLVQGGPITGDPWRACRAPFETGDRLASSACASARSAAALDDASTGGREGLIPPTQAGRPQCR